MLWHILLFSPLRVDMDDKFLASAVAKMKTGAMTSPTSSATTTSASAAAAMKASDTKASGNSGGAGFYEADNHHPFHS